MTSPPHTAAQYLFSHFITCVFLRKLSTELQNAISGHNIVWDGSRVGSTAWFVLYSTGCSLVHFALFFCPKNKNSLTKLVCTFLYRAKIFHIGE